MGHLTPLALLVLAAVLCLAAPATSEVRLPAIFSEKMVLQRDMPVPVWGWAADGEKVTVLFEQGDQKIETVAKDGKWRVDLDPLEAGGPYVLSVLGEKNRIQLRDVMVGEVWITAGQSNMVFEVIDTPTSKQAFAEAGKYPNIRVANAIGGTVVSEAPQEDLISWWGPIKWDSAAWRIRRSSKNQDIPGGYSAVSYYFARELYKHLGGEVPVGMITLLAIRPAQSWVDEKTILATPALKDLAGKGYPNDTSKCFNGGIAPLAPFAARGFIYYQGEMNAGMGRKFQTAMTALIRSWRQAWSRPEMPFLFVQLPGFSGKHQAERDKAIDMDDAKLAELARTGKKTWTDIREAQLLTWRSVPHTGMAVSIDVGEPFDIHPPRKLPVAERLFLQARKVAYGEKGLLASGPIAVAADFQGARAVVRFEQVGEGLVARGGTVKGFELAAADGKFHPADAKIDGDRIVVTAEGVADARGVRYAWAGFPQANLYNKAGLPASPFRLPLADE